MKAERQNTKNEQLKEFLLELETLSKKYGIIISVPAKSVKYGNVKNLEYCIGDDYNKKILSKNVEYEPIKLDVDKRYGLKPLNRGFYMFTERKLNNKSQALKHWELVHSLITQISGAEPKVIKDYLDDMGHQEWYLTFREDEETQIKDITEIYINKIDYALTQYLNSYEA